MSRYKNYDRNSGLSKEDLKKSPPKISTELLKRIFSYLKPYILLLVIVIILILFASVLDLLPSILTGKIIDDGFLKEDYGVVIQLVGYSFLVLIASNLINVVQTYFNSKIAQSISRDMRNQMYQHLQKMPYQFFVTSKQGEITTRMTSDISGVESVVSQTLVSTISNIAVLVTSIIAMVSKNWIMAVVGMVIVPLLVIPTKLVGDKRWELTMESQDASDKMNQIYNETLSVGGQQLVKLFTNEEVENKRFSKVNEIYTQLKIRSSMVGRWLRMSLSTFTNMGPMILYLVGGYLILKLGNTSLTVGDVTVMIALLNRMYRPVNSLMEMQVDFVRAMALFSRIFDYLDMPITIENKKETKTINDFQGNLEFKDVSFRYNESAEILHNVSFSMENNQMVALVGPSGAGKSTIINLIPRLYDVTKGAITLDGVDIRDLDLTTLRNYIGIVSQDVNLFNTTIRENLLYAKEDATEEEMIQAAKEANIHDFIMSLEKGYDSIVGNRGIKLSGGERQRIGIARVILKDPEILILDEATSSLDSISEQLIQDAIEPLLKRRTSIVIAHRLSTIIQADKIIVIDKGKVVEEGNHEELLQLDGVYNQLYQTQFSKVLEHNDSVIEKESD